MLSSANQYYLPLIDTFSIVSLVYASLIPIRQADLKRIIAYSSIVHMNSVVLGLFSSNVQGVSGSVFLMVAHGVVTSGLFFLIGFLYDRHGTKLFYYYGGLIGVMPNFSIHLLLFSLANVGLPLTCNFVGELLVFAALVDSNFFTLMIALTSSVFGISLTMFLFNRVVFGNVSLEHTSGFADLTYYEFLIIFPLASLTIILGIFPDIILATILQSVELIVEESKHVTNAYF